MVAETWAGSGRLSSGHVELRKGDDVYGISEVVGRDQRGFEQLFDGKGGYKNSKGSHKGSSKLESQSVMESNFRLLRKTGRREQIKVSQSRFTGDCKKETKRSSANRVGRGLGPRKKFGQKKTRLRGETKMKDTKSDLSKNEPQSTGKNTPIWRKRVEKKTTKSQRRKEHQRKLEKSRITDACQTEEGGEIRDTSITTKSH